MSKARDLANAGTALGAVTATELGYLDGVTSAVQTQVDAKIAKSTVTAKGDLIVATGSGTVVAQPVGTDGQYLKANSAQADGVEWATVSQYALPSQTGNSGKFLTTNGTAESWASAGTTPTYSDIQPSASQIFTITNVTQSTTTMTYTTSAAHNLTTGMTVTVDGVAASAWSSDNPNATFRILAATSGGTTFTRTVATGTMTYTSGGRVYPASFTPSFIKYVNNTWFVGSYPSGSGMYAWSTDGTNWNINYAGAGTASNNFYWTDIAWNGTTYVLVGTCTTATFGPSIHTNTSLNSNLWTRRTSTFGATLTGSVRAVVWAGGSVNKFVAVGASAVTTSSSTPAAAYSSDGATWTATTLGSLNAHANAIAWDGTNFVVTSGYVDGSNGFYYGGVAYGTTGTSWTSTLWGSGSTYSTTATPRHVQYNTANSRFYIATSINTTYVMAYSDLGTVPRNGNTQAGAGSGATNTIAFPIDQTRYNYSTGSSAGSINNRMRYFGESSTPELEWFLSGQGLVQFDSNGWRTWASNGSELFFATHSLTSNGISPNTLQYPITSASVITAPVNGQISGANQTYQQGFFNGTNWLFISTNSSNYGCKTILV